MLLVVCAVYLVMAPGRWPALAWGCTGIVLRGANLLLFLDETTSG